MSDTKKGKQERKKEKIKRRYDNLDWQGGGPIAMLSFSSNSTKLIYKQTLDAIQVLLLFFLNGPSINKIMLHFIKE